MADRRKAASTSGLASVAGKRLQEEATNDWRSLVEQIAELEDILLECGALQDLDADHGRAWLHDLLLDKRRQLRRIDVAV